MKQNALQIRIVSFRAEELHTLKWKENVHRQKTSYT